MTGRKEALKLHVSDGRLFPGQGRPDREFLSMGRLTCQSQLILYIMIFLTRDMWRYSGQMQARQGVPDYSISVLFLSDMAGLLRLLLLR